ncbi:MAG: hypothetical protein H6R26_1751 [Proteobacteria bacterium]|nr:hypothetical protein [Pseudomonadota bacterium]
MAGCLETPAEVAGGPDVIMKAGWVGRRRTPPARSSEATSPETANSLDFG